MNSIHGSEQLDIRKSALQLREELEAINIEREEYAIIIQCEEYMGKG